MVSILNHDVFSDYIVFVDESGDHGLSKIDPKYPIFVLCFCIFPKSSYKSHVISELTHLKFETFGHDNIILHEHDIRKRIGVFSLMAQKQREDFLNSLTSVIDRLEFTIIAVVIRKDSLRLTPNPYNLAMQYGLELVSNFLKEKVQNECKTHILFECRGKNEDEALELEFRRVCDGKNKTGEHFPFSIQMVDKRSNSPGLQIADMIARPIGLKVLRPDQINRTHEILEKKFFVGTIFSDRLPQKWGFGLKVFP